MKILTYIAILFISVSLKAQNIVKEYTVPKAQQGIAVDKKFFYIINNTSISKHCKKEGLQVAVWEDKDSLLKHMNAGVIIDNKLFCTHSNFPGTPMVSSIEIFDPKTLEHIDSHSFGILNGSATWIDKHKGYWYVAFAHYAGYGGLENRNNSWSKLVKFDSNFRQIESWIFPKELLIKFGKHSSSGGIIFPDGRILCTGHDNLEAYILEFPSKGSTLQLIETINIGSYGQGIAREKIGNSDLIYGLIRSEKKVVVTKINRVKQ